MRKPTVLLLLVVAAICGMLAGCDNGNAAWRARNDEQDVRLAKLRADLDAAQAAVTELEGLHADNAALRARNAELEGLIEELRAQVAAAQQPIEDVTETASVLRCTNHLRQLAALFVTNMMERPGPPKYDGSALLLHYRKKRLIQEGDEEVLLCDLDPLALPSDIGSEAWDDADLGASPRGLCSYPFRAWRSHPIDPEAVTAQPIGCCPHHPEGAIVAFVDGSVRLVTHEELGVPYGIIVVGPRARADLLRPLVYRAR